MFLVLYFGASLYFREGRIFWICLLGFLVADLLVSRFNYILENYQDKLNILAIPPVLCGSMTQADLDLARFEQEEERKQVRASKLLAEKSLDWLRFLLRLLVPFLLVIWLR